MSQTRKTTMIFGGAESCYTMHVEYEAPLRDFSLHGMFIKKAMKTIPCIYPRDPITF